MPKREGCIRVGSAGGPMDCALPLANFLAGGVLRLGRKPGPILWPWPPRMEFEADRLESCLAQGKKTA